jgi:hypothetical protein
LRLICGIVRLDGAEANRSDLLAMFAALTPAGSAPCRHGRVGGCAALGVLDFSSSEGVLPVGPDGAWLAADARLDGAEEANEAQAVFTAFSKRGPDLPGYLHGDYALALWHPGTGSSPWRGTSWRCGRSAISIGQGAFSRSRRCRRGCTLPVSRRAGWT